LVSASVGTRQRNARPGSKPLRRGTGTRPFSFDFDRALLASQASAVRRAHDLHPHREADQALRRRHGAARLDLEIKPGELFFLLGPSGCGKTTLLRCLAGFYIPEEGRIFFGDEDVTRLAPHKRNTGMMFQSYALWPHMTVAENVAFGLEERRLPKAEIRRKVGEALESVHMGAYAARRPNQLSGGQQQRVALARALVIRPAACSSTSRFRTSTRGSGWRCAWRSAGSARSSSSRRST
jgi:ABC-type glutathione transport system ATPase component